MWFYLKNSTVGDKKGVGESQFPESVTWLFGLPGLWKGWNKKVISIYNHHQFAVLQQTWPNQLQDV